MRGRRQHAAARAARALALPFRLCATGERRPWCRAQSRAAGRARAAVPDPQRRRRARARPAGGSPRGPRARDRQAGRAGHVPLRRGLAPERLRRAARPHRPLVRVLRAEARRAARLDLLLDLQHQPAHAGAARGGRLRRGELPRHRRGRRAGLAPRARGLPHPLPLRSRGRARAPLEQRGLLRTRRAPGPQPGAHVPQARRPERAAPAGRRATRRALAALAAGDLRAGARVVRQGAGAAGERRARTLRPAAAGGARDRVGADRCARAGRAAGARDAGRVDRLRRAAGLRAGAASGFADQRDRGRLRRGPAHRALPRGAGAHARGAAPARGPGRGQRLLAGHARLAGAAPGPPRDPATSTTWARRRRATRRWRARAESGSCSSTTTWS